MGHRQKLQALVYETAQTGWNGEVFLRLGLTTILCAILLR